MISTRASVVNGRHLSVCGYNESPGSGQGVIGGGGGLLGGRWDAVGWSSEIGCRQPEDAASLVCASSWTTEHIYQPYFLLI